MPSSYTSPARLEDMANGEKSGSWGDITDTNFALIEEFIAGRAAVTHDDSADYTLTTSNAATDEARPMICNVAGALTQARNVVCPTQSKVYFVRNATTGGFAFTFKTTAGSGISVPNGALKIVYCDGTNVVDAISDLIAGATMNDIALVDLSSSQTLTNKVLTSPTITGFAATSGSWTGGTDLAVADGGTGSSTAADARTALGLAALAILATIDGTHIVVGSDAQGDVLFRGASNYERLGQSTSGHVLKTQGAAADPIFEGSEETVIIAISDETTALTTGTAKVTFRMPFAMTLNAGNAGVRASLTTVSSSGTPTFDINEAGSTILSTKLTIDASELTSVSAATAVVISDVTLADDAEMTIDIDTAGTGAAGAIIMLRGKRT